MYKTLSTNDRMKSPEELLAEAEELESRGDEHGAIAAWRELAARRPDDPVALCRFARLAIRLSEPDEAERALRRAITVDPNLSEAYLVLGSLAQDKWDNEEAEHLLRQALSREKTKEGYSMLGVVLQRLGRNAEAEAAYREAIAIDPEFDEAYYNLGVLLRHTDPPAAERLFSRALSIDPQCARPIANSVGY